jgi:pimeloyl-ACP methyl ester carboxylesterase
MSKATTRGYAGAAGAQLHYRELGEGSPVILLHASPLSSEFMLGQIQALASAGYRAIALDTPGYGQSDPLPEPPQSLADYARAFLAGIDALGLSGSRVSSSTIAACLPRSRWPSGSRCISRTLVLAQTALT